MLRKKITVFLLFLTDILKQTILGGGIGSVVGALGAFFIWLLNTAAGFTNRFEYYYLFLPLAMFLSSFLVERFAPAAEGHGTEKAIEAVHKNNGRIKAKTIPIKIAATVITIAVGGSAGKEGPTTQIGAGAASLAARALRLDEEDTKTLVVCGMGAGFAAILGTPIAAAIFVAEVLVIGRLNLKNIFSALIASLAGHYVFGLFGLRTEEMPDLSGFAVSVSNAPAWLFMAFCAGVFFGLVSLLMITAMRGSARLAEKIRVYKPLKGIIGGAALALLALIFNKNYLGTGVEYFMTIAGGGNVLPHDFMLKILFTAITLSFGGSGGVLTPLMFVGITSGSAFAAFFGLDPVVFSCLGMLAVLAGSTNTPLACIIMAFEMFLSPGLVILSALACPVAYLITGHRSVYHTQFIGESKIRAVYIAPDTIEAHKEKIVYKNGIPSKIAELFKKKG
ncbi:MAG: chloride channel protein [Clostridiales bacterium]|jgi:H+/Cl- antiporter ClcA|nr:chloride channel protein [Clostridiales bacterium]